MQLLHGHVKINSILITVAEKPSQTEASDSDKKYNEQLPISHTKLSYASSAEQLLEYMTLENMLVLCNGPLEHDQFEWIGFFKTIEPLQSQCLTAGRRLVSVLNDIRNADLQGPPTRRQLHSQHRALCRALMDSDLQALRRRAPITLNQLQQHIKRIRRHSVLYTIANASTKTKNLDNDKQHFSIITSLSHQQHNSLNYYHKRNKSDPIGENANGNCKNLCEPSSKTTNVNFVEQRLNGLITVFNEVDRAARRLEQLTEQHRERLRELTRQRALEDEINEVRIEFVFCIPLTRFNQKAFIASLDSLTSYNKFHFKSSCKNFLFYTKTEYSLRISKGVDEKFKEIYSREEFAP